MWRVIMYLMLCTLQERHLNVGWVTLRQHHYFVAELWWIKWQVAAVGILWVGWRDHLTTPCWASVTPLSIAITAPTFHAIAPYSLSCLALLLFDWLMEHYLACSSCRLLCASMKSSLPISTRNWSNAAWTVSLLESHSSSITLISEASQLSLPSLIDLVTWLFLADW